MNTETLKRPLTESQKLALSKMPELADSQFPTMRETIPASVYTDIDRFHEEMAAVFKSVPVIAGPSALLPKPNSYVQKDLVGMPVLLTRTREGQAKAFVNVCRHRGAKLTTKPCPVESGRIVCPYHAWTYGVDGRLVGLPRQETFPGIDKSQLGLTPLPCVEAGGLLWVGLDPKGDPDFSLIEEKVAPDLDALGLGDMHVFDRAIFEIKANWKLVMDTMLDSYHVTRLHKDSLARFFVDAENIIDTIGPHIRAAAARGNFTRAQITDDFEDVRQIMVFAYTLFPNGIIVCSPDFISVGILRPVAPDRSEVDYHMLCNEAPADERMERRLRRSFELMEQAFGKEDYWAAEQCDIGLRTGTIDEVHLGGMEVQISMFHGAVNRCLDTWREKAGGKD